MKDNKTKPIIRQTLSAYMSKTPPSTVQPKSHDTEVVTTIHLIMNDPYGDFEVLARRLAETNINFNFHPHYEGVLIVDLYDLDDAWTLRTCINLSIFTTVFGQRNFYFRVSNERMNKNRVSNNKE